MKSLALTLLASAGTVAILAAQTASDLEVLQVRPNVYMVAGAGGNITVQVGEDGAVVVDAGSATSASSVVAAIKTLTEAPIRYVINTGPDQDHVGGNAVIAKAGQTLFFQRSIGLPNDFLGAGAASILAVENVLTRMSGVAPGTQAFPTDGWPTETFDYARKYMYLNGEGIEVLHQPAAHTDGDAIVFFRRSDVVVAGDIVDVDRFPVIDVARGGTIQGAIDALNRIITLAIPSVPIVSREAGTLVIPGHGRVVDQFDLLGYRDMVTIVSDRVRDLQAAGMSLEQVRAARPARGYTSRYGEASANAFVEAVYRTRQQQEKS